MKRIIHIISVYIALLLTIGVRAQETIVNPLETKIESLHQLKGEIVVISILHPKYSDDIEKLNELAEKYKNKKVTFIAIKDKNNKYDHEKLKNKMVNYKYLSEEESERVFNSHQSGTFKVFPIQVILNKEGEVYYIKKGATNNIHKKLEKRINRLIVKD